MKGNLFVIGIVVFFAFVACGLYFLLRGTDAEDIEKASGSYTRELSSGHSGGGASSGSSASKSKGVDSSGGSTQAGGLANGSSFASDSGYAIDQTLNPKTGVANQYAADVLGAVKDPISVELTLIDGLENKPLESLPIELKLRFSNMQESKETLTTDADGKVVFMAAENGSAALRLFTEKYAVYSGVLVLKRGGNAQTIKLYKGGTLEIKVKTSDHKVVESVLAKTHTNAAPSPGMRFMRSRRFLQDDTEMTYDQARGIFFLNNLPEGANDLSFKADGYTETVSYKVVIDSVTPVQLEVLLNPARILSFDLEIAEKPEMIYVTEGRMSVTRVAPRGRFASGNMASSVTTNDMNATGFRDEQATGTAIQSVPLGVTRGGDQVEVLKASSGLFEYEVTQSKTTSVTLFVNKYLPKEVTLTPEDNLYKVSLVAGSEGQLFLKNEKGEPVVGATVNYSYGLGRGTTVSDADGLALVGSVSEKATLRLNISHKEYAPVNEAWQFDATEANSKTITMVEGKGISGRVLLQNKPVMNARVLLYQGNSGASPSRTSSSNGGVTMDSIDRFPSVRMDSGSNGEYYFGNLGNSKGRTYTIKAFHKDYGVASVSSITFEEGSKVVDLELVEEKSALLKLVDQDQKPLSNMKISLVNSFEQDFSVDCVTDENGTVQLLNMLHGYYFINLEDDEYKLRTRNLQIPTSSVTLVAEGKDLRPIRVSVKSGVAFKGVLRASIEVSPGNLWPLNVITKDDGAMFLEIADRGGMRFGTFLFEAQGYAVTKLGPYNDRKSIPAEFKVSLQEGDNFTVKVVDDISGSALAGAVVNVFVGGVKIQALPTNELGEILFTHLADTFNIVVNEPNYCTFNESIDGHKVKEIVVSLKHGGGLAGKLTLDKDVRAAWVLLQPSGGNQSISAEGKFEYSNLLPGEYSLTVTQNMRDGKNKIEKMPVRIVIEEGKIFEIDLDEYRKNQTTLDVSVYKDGLLSNERGFLSISDRRGMAVVTAEITTGKYQVEKLLPGEYLLSYNYQGKALRKTLTVLPNAKNVVDIFVPGSSLTIAVKNEDGKPISKVMITLYAGEKYRQEDTYLGTPLVTDANGTGTFLLMPKSPYYFVVEEDFRFNYQVNVIGPIMLDAGQSSRIEYVLPYARKLANIQITDKANKPLSDVGFIFNDESGNFFQRTLKKDWDLYPFSNKDGFLPENCWPLQNFTLIVGKEGYEFKEVNINSSFDAGQSLQVVLNKASAIRVNFPQTLPLPISVGILNKDGVLLQKPIPLKARTKHELTVYFENVSFGNVTFNDLSAGTYFIGYFWNGSNRLISRQGPILLGLEETQNINSTLQITDY